MDAEQGAEPSGVGSDARKHREAVVKPDPESYLSAEDIDHLLGGSGATVRPTGSVR